MYSTSTTPPPFTATTLLPTLPPSLQIPFFTFPARLRQHRCQTRITLQVKPSHKPLTTCNTTNALQFPNLSPVIKPEGNPTPRNDENVLNRLAKPIALALFWVVIGLCPIRGFQSPALAAPVASEAIGSTKTREKEEESSRKGHEYSNCTRKLLETVSELIRVMEEVRSDNGDVKKVEVALRNVKTRRKELEEEILSGMYAELRVLKGEKEVLMSRSDEILDAVGWAKREREGLLRNQGGGEEGNERAAKLEEEVIEGEKEYNEVWEKIGKIEDAILRRETLALSVGVRELSFIQRESELLVEGFKRKMRETDSGSVSKRSLTKLSKYDIQKELQAAQRQILEQMILPNILEDKYFGHLFDPDSVEFAQRIKRALQESSEMQRNMESGIRKKMKKSGAEKRVVVNSSVDEIVKGFPEVELKWMFGGKEVVVPKAVRLHLFHGWKKWREETKADLKRNLLEDVELGKKYVAQRQAKSMFLVNFHNSSKIIYLVERILLDRDRVTSKTWYNEERSRWEIDPIAVPYAVSRKLVENARIRHDWAAMYISLKGDDKEYYVDIKEFEMLYEDFGGFDGLYLRMLASRIPTAVQLMWIPFSELNFSQQFLLIMRLSHQLVNGLWNTKVISYVREWTFEKIKNLNDDIVMVIFFPLVEFFIPYPVRMQLGMAWPEYIDQSVGSTWYLKWQSEAEMRFRSRNTDQFRWYFWFFIRTIIYGYVLFNVFLFLKRKIPRVLGFGPIRRDPNFRKLRRVKAYFKYRMQSTRRKKKAGVDPISTAFDQMKRVKNPPIRLRDFASVESMREEINEVVAFLQNPRAFQEMGARAPKGVLIVGERGTGKTSLALAIAAEAKVPVVEVKAQQLEAGLWVGQSASNVRELFQTARDLAPVIIFVEDFDLFAGVRGKFIHTKKQDHEAFINQLLVELDGFEKQDGVVLMATTRNLKQIDEALQRPGRMDRIFYLQRPTQTEREKILRNAAKETMDAELIDFVDWERVAEKTALLRPVELKLVPVALEGSAFRSKFLDTDELMSYCSWFATFSSLVPNWVRKTKILKSMSKMLVDHLGLTLMKEDLQNVVDLMEPYGQISNGIELLNPPLDLVVVNGQDCVFKGQWTRETKFPHAVWAAGRGLIALLLPNFDVVDNLWLEPFSWEGIGCTKITKANNEGSLNGNVESRAYLEKTLVFCFGSYVAAQLLLPFGEENILSSSELKQAQEIATRMVIQYGWGPDDSPTIYHHGNAVTALSMGNNHEYEMAAKVEKMYYLAFDKAKEILQKNRVVLEKIVEELLEFEILTGKVKSSYLNEIMN
ncbi:hypothetical protein RJ640_019409 [Escallonia rubra]|uniref:AAA+ ATPase domain-containing protein n=1 Tax=Escallonia rubra TaxID=112253 RepID=A0AA88R4T0_9ASTE|nr:hypothetical protein RJ640_019409 [Escallonia rubra]